VLGFTDKVVDVVVVVESVMWGVDPPHPARPNARLSMTDAQNRETALNRMPRRYRQTVR